MGPSNDPAPVQATVEEQTMALFQAQALDEPMDISRVLRSEYRQFSQTQAPVIALGLALPNPGSAPPALADIDKDPVMRSLEWKHIRDKRSVTLKEGDIPTVLYEQMRTVDAVNNAMKHLEAIPVSPEKTAFMAKFNHVKERLFNEMETNLKLHSSDVMAMVCLDCPEFFEQYMATNPDPNAKFLKKIVQYTDKPIKRHKRKEESSLFIRQSERKRQAFDFIRDYQGQVPVFPDVVSKHQDVYRLIDASVPLLIPLMPDFSVMDQSTLNQALFCLTDQEAAQLVQNSYETGNPFNQIKPMLKAFLESDPSRLGDYLDVFGQSVPQDKDWYAYLLTRMSQCDPLKPDILNHMAQMAQNVQPNQYKAFFDTAFKKSSSGTLSFISQCVSHQTCRPLIEHFFQNLSDYAFSSHCSVSQYRALTQIMDKVDGNPVYAEFREKDDRLATSNLINASF